MDAMILRRRSFQPITALAGVILAECLGGWGAQVWAKKPDIQRSVRGSSRPYEEVEYLEPHYDGQSRGLFGPRKTSRRKGAIGAGGEGHISPGDRRQENTLLASDAEAQEAATADAPEEETTGWVSRSLLAGLMLLLWFGFGLLVLYAVWDKYRRRPPPGHRIVR